jgi:hypothetical protein
MEDKYKRYTEYSWKDNEKWINYFNSLYPVPPLKLVEKRKKKFYRDNIDKDFDIDYNPEEEGKNQQNQQNQQQRQGPPPGANPYAYAYNQAVYEAMPGLKPYVALAYLGFVLTLFFSSISTKICLVA